MTAARTAVNHMPVDVDPQQYKRDGFSFPHRVIPTEDADRLRVDLEQLVDTHANAATAVPFGDYARSNLHVVSTAVAQMARHPSILDAVETIIGPDISLWGAELIAKEPNSDKVLTMHQDLTYWGLDGSDGVVTAWLAVSDVTTANGAMSFVPASHHHGQLVHHDTFRDDNLLSRGQEIAVDVRPEDTVPVELERGEISLHHGLMFHGSGPNTTAERRIGLVLRYLAPSVVQPDGNVDFVMACRGVNRSTTLLAISPPERDFSPAAVDLHAEITAAQSFSLGAGATEKLSYSRTE